jgi:prepilin-type N-terminal cleavage/methylation domain-containing protein
VEDSCDLREIDPHERDMALVRAKSGERGFTLVEMMVVVAIIGVVSILAVQTPEEDDATVDGVAAQVQTELDQSRLRSIANHQWQRMIVSGKTVTFQIGNTIGMVPPTTWTLDRALTIPSNVQLVAIGSTSAIDPLGAAPSVGTGFTDGVTFAPDGSSVSRTIYFSDARGQSPTRVVVFATTGTTLTRSGW